MAGAGGGAGGSMLCAGVDCGDANECTVDTCDPLDGECGYANVANGMTCDFGGLPGVCGAGVCEDAMLCAGVDCDDQNACTTDTCNSLDGSCNYANVTDGTTCDFGDLPGICGAGVCEDAMLCAAVDCNDQDECTDDACDPMNGQCDYTNVMGGTACDLGGAAGVCEAGTCVYARSWGTPELIEASDLYAGFYPAAAVDPDGNVTAVWNHTGGASANRYTSSGGWGSPVPIGGEGAVDSNDTMDVAVDSNGNATAVWSQGSGVWSNRYDASGGWGSAELISPVGNSQRRHPRVAVDPQGNVTAVWFQGDPTHVWANRYTPSGGWGTAVVVDASLGNVHEPAVAADTDGNVTVVWAQWDAVIFNVWANRYTSDGWGTPVLIETEDTPATGTQVAADSLGNVVAVWVQSGTRANRYTPGSGWGSAVPVPAGSNPKVAAGPEGTAVVVSSSGASWYTPGVGWGPAQGQGHGLSSRVDIYVDSKGNAAAVGTRQQLTKDVWANRYTPSGGWGTPVLIETNDTGDAFGPRVVIAPNGDVTAVWSQRDPGNWNWFNIWSNRFE
jgi:hypothetical protein